MSNITKAIRQGWDSLGNPSFTVKSTDWDGYPKGSVLEGQPIVKWLGQYEYPELAQAAHPDAEMEGAVGQNYTHHLPDETDYSTRTMHDTWEGEQ